MGPGCLKLGYWEYRPFGTLAAQVDDARAKLGRLVGARPQVPRPALRPLPLGSVRRLWRADALPRPQGLPAGRRRGLRRPDAHDDRRRPTGWELGLDLLAPWLALVGVKNFRWLPPTATATASGAGVGSTAPSPTGMAPLPEFIGYLRQLRYDGVVSLHSEYKGESSFRR